MKEQYHASWAYYILKMPSPSGEWTYNLTEYYGSVESNILIQYIQIIPFIFYIKYQF